MLTPSALWVDPGEVTGVAQFENHYGVFRAAEYPAEEAWDYIESWCRMQGSALSIGWERYTITAGTHKLTAQPAALETIGVCRYLSRLHGCRVLQPAQQHTPDARDQARLKQLGWWVPGKDDAQSAAAHLLNWLLRENELPPRERQILGIGR
ncbi:MAG TPA: hypothetical protein VGI66_03470 [Streptosporangiaceae bacterium]|jgi:hypothetical protein